MTQGTREGALWRAVCLGGPLAQKVLIQCTHGAQMVRRAGLRVCRRDEYFIGVPSDLTHYP